MPSARLTRRLTGGLAVATLIGAWCLASGPAQAQPAPGAPSSAMVEVPQYAGPPGVRTARHPLLLKVRGQDGQFRPLDEYPGPGGYTAAQLRAATGLAGTGKGQTVAIVDAFHDPYAVQELNAYSEQMGLPGVCARKKAKNCFTFTQQDPFGIGGSDPGWGVETALDIEMVHAMAPDAGITLVEAVDPSTDALFQAEQYAADQHPAAISNSWGFSDTEDPTETSFDHFCELADGVCVFSTGDTGYPGSYPAYNPHVLAVGGTRLVLDRAGKPLSETAWSDGGGGVSQVEPRPAYQPEALNPSSGRGIPDVSFDADISSGVALYSTWLDGWAEAGGTSVGAPAWSGILAVADQERAAAGRPPLTAAGDEVHNAVYGLAGGLADVTSGSNGTCDAFCTAGPGYDFVTGLGSPRPGIDTGLAAAP